MSRFDKPIQTSSMFVGVVEAYTQSGAPERYSTWVGSSLVLKYLRG
jgi:hypothetical protein